MIGTIVNTCTICGGSILGSIIKKGLKQKYQDVLFTAMGLTATALGIYAVVSHMPESRFPVLFIVSLAIGGIFGTWLDLDGKFQKLVARFSNGNLGEGLATGVLLYCIGTLSILGPVMSALYGDETYLFTNATLDLVTSMVLASTYGFGMIFAAPILFCWQSLFYLLAKYVCTAFFTGDALTDLITELSIVGGILIASSGIGILKIKDCKTLNLLPALLVPIIFIAVRGIV
ncbi:MAG: DUF554 domain-containing protein [Agathobacter sp.]|nr:DUF554 domain-containing protein [Agathobacter sp.]